LKAEVKQELIGNAAFNATGVSRHSTELGFQATEKNLAMPGRVDDTLADVDMMDVAELEKERGENAPASSKPNEADEELARARLQRQALTFEQKCLIEKIIDEKVANFSYQIKMQFNNMHLELIKNF